MLRSKMKTRCPQCRQSSTSKRSFSYENSLQQFKCYKCGYHTYFDLTWNSESGTLVVYDSSESGEQNA